MKMLAPDTLRPRGVEPIPVHGQQGIWVVIGMIAGFLLDLIPVLPLPERLKPWLPAITALLGLLAHWQWGPAQYRPVPPSIP